MKLQFKHQKFQADAAKAVVDVFAGQPYLTPTYMIDRGVARDRYGLSGYTTDVGRILRTFKIKKNVEVTDNGKIII
jgi:type III restriction enzyme